MQHRYNIWVYACALIFGILCGGGQYTLDRQNANPEAMSQSSTFVSPAPLVRPVTSSPIANTLMQPSGEAGRSVDNKYHVALTDMPGRQGNNNLVTNTTDPITNTPDYSTSMAMNTNTVTPGNLISGPPSNLTVNLPPGALVPVQPKPGVTNEPGMTTLAVRVLGTENHPLEVTFYGRPIQASAEPDFTIIAVPDTQNYASLYPEILSLQTEWILNNRDSSNILYVAGLGDNVAEPLSVTEWLNVDAAWNLLDRTDMPYGLATGNHDGGLSHTENFNKYFGVLRFEGRPYYGGHFGSSNDSHFDLFTANQLNFIVIYIEYDNDMTKGNHPVLQWANSLLQRYSGRRAIVISHNMLQRKTSNVFTPQGQAIYKALRRNPNLFLLLGGHWDVAARRADTFEGNTVYTLRSDYQDVDNMQSGYLRIMRFSPANNMIYISTYSPTQHKFYDKPDAGQNIFNLPYTMEKPAFEVIGAVSGVTPGDTVSVPWLNLDVNKTYQWFVTAADDTQQVSSDVLTFRTEINSAPPVNDQAVITSEDTALPITLTETDENGDLPGYVVLSGPSHGSLSGTAPTLTYIPEADYYGSDLFTFQADNGEVSSTASVSITINPINDAPLCMDVNLQAQSNGTGQVDTACTDKESGALSYSIVDQPRYGTASVIDGRLEYVPQNGYSGSDSFTYKSNDGVADSNIAIVNVTVSSASAAPAAEN